MKRLTLIRHAKSDWGDSSLSDFDRPLNKRGQRDAPAMADYYKNTGAKPDVIISSPALRAKTTANYFLSAFSLTESQLNLERGIYEASPSELMTIINSLDEKWNNVLMFGHNPGFSMLATELTNEYYHKVTCSVSELELYVENWNEVINGSGKLVHFDYPKNHTDLQKI